jgi:hypothetical protein
MVGLQAQRVNGVTVCTGADEPWRASLSDRILIAENRCAALFGGRMVTDVGLHLMQVSRRGLRV